MDDKLLEKQSPGDSIRQIIAALFAPFIAIGAAFASLYGFVAAVPPPVAKDSSLFAFLACGFIGLLAGRLFYRLVAPASAKRKPLSWDDSPLLGPNGWARRIWCVGLIVQLVLFIALIIVVFGDVEVVAEKYRNVVWYGYNAIIFFLMLISLLSIFWMFKRVADRVTYVFWSACLFACLYLAFLYCAIDRARPSSIPYKISW